MARQSLRAEQIMEVEIAPEVATRISAILSTHSALKEQADLLYEAMEIENKKIFAMLEEAGLSKANVDGTPLCIVRGYSSKLDKAKFVTMGGSLKVLEDATVSKPKKAYLRIGAAKEEGEAA